MWSVICADVREAPDLSDVPQKRDPSGGFAR